MVAMAWAVLPTLADYLSVQMISSEIRSLDGAPGEPSRPESEVTSHSEKTYEFSRRAERPIKGMGPVEKVWVLEDQAELRALLSFLRDHRAMSQ